ncbi:MAG: 3-dehydroquinate synthase [candidate division Zixibacteria bacterium]|nr:3-dehydroquinate synthase [candidate division Zixibacteria bacterium]
MPQINIKLKAGSYPVVIGNRIDNKFLSLLKTNAQNRRVFVFFDARFYALHGKKIESLLKSKKYRIKTFVIPSGEKSKSASALKKIYDFLLHNKISRDDFILACGGGVTTDLVGYAAATTLRGIRWGAVSTTLLGMVDAAIGGKTGINHESGKNLIGAFWQPSFVICNTEHLQTLPEREMIAGLGEVIKYGGLIGNDLIDEIEKFLRKGDLYDTKALEKLINVSVRYKGSIVAQDEREENIRMFLNLGHTFGHAIEKTLGYGKLLHGEAIIIGLLAAVILSRKVNRTSTKVLAGYESLLKKCLRFLRYFPLKPAEIFKNMQIDKKRSGQELRFVLLKRPGKPFIASGLRPKLIIDSVKECLALYKAEGR